MELEISPQTLAPHSHSAPLRFGDCRACVAAHVDVEARKEKTEPRFRRRRRGSLLGESIAHHGETVSEILQYSKPSEL